MSARQAPSKHVPSPAHIPRKPQARSRLTNRIGAILTGDARSVAARRYRDVVAALVTEQGGADHLSDMRLILIRRVAGLVVLAEQTEASLCNGETVDVKEIALISSTLARLSSRIGLNRVAKDVTPSLDEIEREYGKLHGQRPIRPQVIEHELDGDDDD